MGDILKEAIAEAKIVREIAYENAKATMTEAFEPKIKSMLSTKLQTEDDDSDDDLPVDDIPKDEDDKDDEDVTEDNLPDDEEEIGDEEEASENNIKEMDDDENNDDEDENDAEFESVLKELEDELDDDDKDTEEDDEVTEDDSLDDNETDDDDELTDKDLDELLGDDENNDDEDDYEDDKEPTDEKRRLSSLRSENIKLKNNIKEYSRVIRYLKKELNEINLLNSKLLHTTKLFRRFNLRNEEKTKIVNTFDRTKTIREIKLIYTTLIEALSVKPTKKRNRLSENSSKFIGGTKPNRKDVITEEVDFKERLKELAGIDN